jgi:hypothetical protein
MERCVNTKEFVEINPNPIPDGNYSGIWSGFEIKFSVGKRSFLTETEIGVRGKIPCVVHVVNNQIWVN